MSAKNEHAASAGHDAEHEHHLTPYSTYVVVWLVLIGLTVVTVLAAYANLHHMAIFVALLVACAKSLIVILWFMHIKYEGRLFMWFLIAGFGTYAIFVALTFADYSFR